MLCARSGFVTKIKRKSLSVVGSYYAIHREALAARTLPVELMNSLNSIINIVNFIKGGTLNTRLFARLCHDIGVRRLSKGNMLERFYEIKDEVKRRISDRNTGPFSHHDEALKDKLLDDNFQQLIQTHLQVLRDEFCRNFPNIEEENSEWKLIRNPFFTDVEDVPMDIQEEFLDMKWDSSAKDDFNRLSEDEFWLKYLEIYHNVSLLALRVTIRFSSTYLFKAGFSTLVYIKNWYRNRMDVENGMRCALSETHPRIKRLVEKKQYILHIDGAVFTILTIITIIEIVVFFQFVSQKKCRRRDNSQIGQGGMGSKCSRTPG
ncbi:SCAN domain-containing protein 3 [Oopsacas minuta]|uniref:SCAN domain-containing protein 3 n=1 Tax=Oopsacas minuta TaxID=111878 RepID=A0AAV7JMR9_9METZ|nr:SCAN domain-containing protein 3 [Oopsacas minuta]